VIEVHALPGSIPLVANDGRGFGVGDDSAVRAGVATELELAVGGGVGKGAPEPVGLAGLGP
jgi:hypothetical protein